MKHGAPTNVAAQEALGTRLRAARIRSGLTQQRAARSVGVATQTLRGWELGLHAPKFWRFPRLSAAYGAPLGALLVDDPAATCLAEVWVGRDTLRDVRAGGRAHALEVAERIARQLEPELWRAATGRLPRAQDTPARAKPRRSRAEVLAGVKAASEASARAKLRALESTLQELTADPQAEGAGGGAEAPGS